MWPGTCAPSTIDRTPAFRAASQISSIGRTSAVGDVMWETTIARVRIPMFAISSAGSTSTTFARMNPSVRRIAPYSCFVVRISSSGRMRSERMTALSADVAFGEKTRSSTRAPTNPARRHGPRHRLVEAASEDRSASLELELPPLVVREHLQGTRAVAPVVEVGDVGIEEETLAHRWLVSHGARTSLHVLSATPALRPHAPSGRAHQLVREREVIPSCSFTLLRRWIEPGAQGGRRGARGLEPPCWPGLLETSVVSFSPRRRSPSSSSSWSCSRSASACMAPLQRRSRRISQSHASWAGTWPSTHCRGRSGSRSALRSEERGSRCRPTVWIAAASLCAIGAAYTLVVEGALPIRARRTPIPAAVSA